MANPQPTPGEIPGFNSKLDTLQQQAGIYQSSLGASPTSYGDAPPSKSDITNQEELNKIQKSIQSIQDKKLKAQWYPPAQQDTANEINPGNDVSPGIIGSTLDWLGRPVRAIVGAVKHFSGQGTDSLVKDMGDNIIKDKEYFGDVLSRAGLPGWVSAPLGFGLDIALDPVNWVTMGEAALIPKITGGLFRGGLKGATVAAKAGVLEKAVTAGKFIPGLKSSETFASIGKKSLSATNKYESITGQTAENILQHSGAGVGRYRVPLSEVINKVADVVPGGQTVLKTLVYDPIGWVKQTVDMDIIKRSFGSAGIVDLKGALEADAKGLPITKYMKPAEEIIKSTPPGAALDFAASDVSIISQGEIDQALAKLPTDLGARLAEKTPAIHKITSAVDDVAEINKNPSIGITGDALTNGLRILNETGFGGGGITMEEVAGIVNSGVLGETGVKWFDGMMQGIEDFGSKVGANGERIGGIGKATLSYYDKFMGLFRGAVVGGSPVGHMNALFGNAIMNHLGIGDIGPEYWSRYKQVFDMYRNVPGSAAKLQGLLMDAGVWEQVKIGLEAMPTAARGTFGEMPRFLNAKAEAEMLMRNFASEAGKVSGFNAAGMTAETLEPFMNPIIEDMRKFQASLPAKPDLSGTATVRAMKGAVSRLEAPTDMISQELFDKPAARAMFDHIADMAEQNPGNLGWKAMDFVYNKMTNQYAKWDQISKTTTFLRSTMDGYTLPQLMKARHLITINAEDISMIKGGVNFANRYRLNSQKGIELANALYMNYAAMPSAVRVLRNMPLVGNPFVSFMYGMALKTGQTLAYNPSAFNKVSFALNEFGGTPTALEKQALNDPSGIYSYLKQPGMYRLPFTDANPIYINLANMIPYYSMNMFNPSQQHYNAGDLSSSFINLVNTSPFLKEPIGTVLFNNLIQPAILSEGIQPQNQFGSAIWPSDADFLTKLGYTARDISGAIVPGVASLTGLAGGLAAPGVTPYVPLYGYRTLANAVQGKNVYGISGKESIPSRTVRGILSRGLGIPVQAPVNTTFTPKQ